MKSTGIVRKVDELGRIVLPIELRRSLNIDVKDSLEIFVGDDGKIILQKYSKRLLENLHQNIKILFVIKPTKVVGNYFTVPTT